MNINFTPTKTDNAPLLVLLIEDDEDDYIYVRDILQDVDGRSYHIQWVDNYHDAQKITDQKKFDVYLLDFFLGEIDKTGLHLLEEIKSKQHDVPVIIMTGKGDHMLDVQAMQAGAADFLTKGDFTPEMLERSMRYAITQYRTLNQLRESQQQIRDFLENATDLILILDADGQFVFANRACTDILKYNDTDLQTLKLEDIIHPDCKHTISQFYELLDHESANGVIITTAFQSKDGTKIEVEGNINSRQENGYGVSIRGIFRNMTQVNKFQRQQLEFNLQREKNQQLRQMVMDLSHDIRTPLTGLSTSVYLMGKSKTEQDRIRHQDKIEYQIERLNKMAEKLLSVTRLSNDTQFELASTDINKLIKDIASTFVDSYHFKEIALLLHLYDELPHIEIDVFHFERVISNLLENALNYTDVGGIVTILTQQLSDKLVEITITDTGIGIPPEELPNIFNEFYRVDKARTDGNRLGLGLAITHRIITLMGGNIFVESIVGEGTTFKIQFPIQR